MIDVQDAALLVLDGAWLVWLAIWIVLARRTKKILRQESPLSRALHIVPLVLATALLLIDRTGLPWLDAPVLHRAGWMIYAGAALVAAGLAFTVWARLVLAGNWSGTVTLKESHELIRRGPYALVRHPIYTGLVTAFLGTAIAIDAWRGVLAVAIVLLSLLHKMRNEEAFMRGAFGAAYDEYARGVPALVPAVGRRK